MRVFLALFLLLFMQPLFVSAQFSSNEFLDTNLGLELQPSYPQPGEPVTITLNDYSGNYYGAALEWYKGTTMIPGSLNQRSVTITTPPIGTKETISLALKMPTGATEIIKKELAPLYADIIIEPQTHVPSFYKGRALASAGSTVNLTALLSDGTLYGTDLMYRWQVNEDVIQGGALRGQHKVSFVMPQDKEVIISLQISTPAGVVLADRSVSIPSTQPELRFYEINTLYGIETKAIRDSFIMIGNSATIQAEPYYLDSNVYNNPSLFEWTINRDEVSTPSNNPYQLMIEKTGITGKASIGLHVRSTVDFLQGAQGEFVIDL